MYPSCYVGNLIIPTAIPAMSILTHHTTLNAYLKLILVKYKVYFMALFFVAIIAALFQVSVDYKIKEIIDSISADKNASVQGLLALFVFYKLMHHGMFFIQRVLNIKYNPLLIAQTVEDMYKKTVGHSLHWFDSHLSGEISSKIADFQKNITDLINYCFRGLNNVSSIVICILFLLQVNFLSAAAIFFFVLIYSPILAFLLRRQMQLQEQCVAARQETLGIVNDSIANIFGIKVIGSLWAEFKLKLTPAIQKWSLWDKKTREFDAYFVDNADTLLTTVMAAVQISLTAYLYQSGQITAGGFAFIALVTLNIHAEIEHFLESLLFNINPSIASMKASYKFINAERDTEDSPHAIELTHVRGDIRYENVCFAYDKNYYDVLHHINLSINAGERVGIVGTSGAGKTTFIKCLLRYFDIQSGNIFIDDKNIKEVTQESLRANISVIPQDITMFHRSILENLQLARYDASFSQIVEACKRARVHDDILNMPKGYDSIVGERGVKVSGGQRQRIAIARAILKNAPILILDEATSALDTPTEKLIQTSLNEMFETARFTTIVIAHRLSTLLHMDRILVFEQGKIVEAGTHQELLAMKGLYQTLWDAQVGGFLQ